MGPHARIVQGILDYARKHADWTLVGGPENVTLSIPRLKGWLGDGIIADVFTRKDELAAQKLGVPVVNLSGSLGKSELPRVSSDHRMIGQLGAEELLRCEIRRFGYYGLTGVWYSQERGRGFVERIDREGHQCSVLQAASTLEGRATWYGWLEELQQWLKTIQPPFGLMAVNDHRARMAVDACRQIGLNIPHDVAVIGTDNDLIACEASQPTLSTVARNDEAIGYKAAELLDALMSRKRVVRRAITIEPLGVISRGSTDMVAIDDPKLSAAVQFIRKHLDKPFNVEDLLREVGVSRRWLEYRFRDRFGRSPYAYLCEARIERAKLLLRRTPKLRLEEIARTCGFADVRSLRLVFHRLTGLRPIEYRRAEVSR